MIRALIAGLCVAAVAAIVALLQGDFGDTHARIVGTSLGFSFFCGLGAAGDALRTQARGALATAGAVASGLAAFAFVLLTLAIWFDDSDSEFLWRAWGVVAITALWASHWSLVLRARRPADTSAVRTIALISIVTATFDMFVGNLAAAGLYEDISDAFARILGVVLVITVLTTALPPIMRRLAGTPRPDALGHRLTVGDLAHEISAAAGRVERIATPEDAQREAAVLRRLAERAHD